MSTTVFEPTHIGPTPIRNRVVVAPMTRVSAVADGTVTSRIRDYYRRFAAGGFGAIVTEGLFIDTAHSQTYLHQAGLATDAHVAAWREVTAVVHAEGTAMFAQLQHGGPQAQGNVYGFEPLGPTAVPAPGSQLGMYRGSGPYPTPTAVTTDQIAAIRQAFVDSALRAREAGFDGVEIHGANGYLLDSFLTEYLNERTDEYGGSPENRARLLVEIAADVRAAVGADLTVGIRISQGKVSNFAHKWTGGAAEAEAIFRALASARLDYVHTTEYVATEPAFADDPRSLGQLAQQFSGTTVIANGGIHTGADAEQILSGGHGDVVALGRAALSNHDWPQRVGSGVALDDLFDVKALGDVADVKDWELSGV